MKKNIRKEFTNFKNEFISVGNIVDIKLQNKKGKEFIAKIDADDLDKVKSFGVWFAQWNKDVNGYMAQSISENEKDAKGNPKKQTLQGLILDVSAKAPIKHINGDFLDNRKSNIEIIDISQKNDFEEKEDGIYIILKNKFGVEEARAIISKDDKEFILKEGYNWVVYRNIVVANTVEGRVQLDKYLLNPAIDEIVHHINLNPLDNRRNNLELQVIE
ncbi:MAG: hypothetical protein ACRCYE_03415 [Sarcina sp.]